jgi:hypothetical protein
MDYENFDEIGGRERCLDQLDGPIRIYIASSWKNRHHDAVVAALTAAGVPVYNYRKPLNDDRPGFSWAKVEADWHAWSIDQYIAALKTETAHRAFKTDMSGLIWCTHLLLVMPSGRSAFWECGWATASGKKTIILHEPDAGADAFDLMTANAEHVTSIEAAVAVLLP